MNISMKGFSGHTSARRLAGAAAVLGATLGVSLVGPHRAYAAGYDLYAQQIEAAAVPEATSTVSLALLLTLGLGSLAVAAAKRKARACR